MLFTFYNIDKPGTAELRARVRPQHKDYLKRVEDRIAFAGPLLAADGQTMAGSLLVIDFPDRAAAEAWLAAEPFVGVGLYERTEIRAFQNLWPQRTGFPPAA